MNRDNATAPPSRLQAIVDANQPRVDRLQAQHALDDLLARATSLPAPRGFARALRQPGMRLIAEVKHASPSAGVICKDFDHLRLARAYEAAGADCVSVLTEELHFKGAPEYLTEIRQTIALPCLRKDFLICPHQIVEARLLGADAVLLIVALLSTDALRDLRRLAESLGMDALVEVHDEAELKRALESEATLIGVNNRNLHTFEVSLETSFRLRARTPQDKIFISESGIKTRDDVERLEAAGVDAILVGETIAGSDDPSKAIEMLLER